MTNNSSDTEQVPTHIAVIMDGNGRWAKSRGLPRVAGHRAGADAVRRIVEAAASAGVSYLTLYSFSSENWKRPEEEVRDLMGLLRRYLKAEIAELHGKDIRFKVIGDRKRLAPDIIRLIEDAEEMTAENSRMTLVLALSYGAREEIASAARKLAQSAAMGLINPEAIDEEVFAAHLYTGGIPDPDLLIRTSGEQRISNFLLWQMAYTEFTFVDKFWPDFSEEDLGQAIRDYSKRERRYGAVVHNR
ncbi:isoprenyl transferase [Aestuariispira ectoiniformans]|uniref:isoprenyl transferase n=1 Tax=Aestuariispira ectoiniformans TaxID=2775080 RepID=UPI00223B7075|nr:isoprenyl transferase [Aestuariispira ectoiniformans]